MTDFAQASTKDEGITSRPLPISLRATRFPLLDLPIELQRLIFFHCFGGHYDITLEYERLTMLRSRFHVKGIPAYDLLLVSKYVCGHAGPLRLSLFTGRLILHSVFILVTIRRSERFLWLKDHTRILHFSDSSVHPERWSGYYSSFQALRRLEIDFPRTKKLEYGDLDRILNGMEDDMLVASMDAFQLSLVDQTREGKIEVILSQRFALKEGIEGWQGIVKVQIRLNADGMEVLNRQHVVEQDASSASYRQREL